MVFPLRDDCRCQWRRQRRKSLSLNKWWSYGAEIPPSAWNLCRLRKGESIANRVYWTNIGLRLHFWATVASSYAVEIQTDGFPLRNQRGPQGVWCASIYAAGQHRKRSRLDSYKDKLEFNRWINFSLGRGSVSPVRRPWTWCMHDGRHMQKQRATAWRALSRGKIYLDEFMRIYSDMRSSKTPVPT